jgi:hypothetical protein
MKKCKNCNNTLQNQSAMFCNKSCSATYNNKNRKPRTLESKIKTAKSVCKTIGVEYKPKGLSKPNHLIRATKSGWPYTKVHQCTFCKKFFNYEIRKSSTCSDKCFIDVKTKLNNRGKKCTYKGIAFDSLWEKKLAIFLDSKNINWERPIVSLPWFDYKGKQRKYFPDFYLSDYDIYLDPKNKQVQKDQKEKLKYIEENYNNIIVGTLDEILAYLEGVEPSCNPITLSTGS